jgi:hypothetical protein
MAPHTPPLAHGVTTGPTRLPKQSLPARRRVKMALHRGIVTGIIPAGPGSCSPAWRRNWP